MLKKVRMEDIDSIFNMEEMCFGPDAWPRKAFEDELSGNFARTSAVIRDGTGNVIAYRISRTFMDETEILKLAVHPLHRRKGLAKLLLRDALNSVRGTVLLEVASDNKEAIMLYSGMGFKKLAVRKNYYRGSGRDAFVMAAEASEKCET